MKFITNLDLNKNELRNAVLHPLGTAPENPRAGQVYYNSSDGLIYCYHNSTWVVVGDGDMKKSVYDPNNGAKQVAFDADVVKKNADITAATKCKITYDKKGLVTAGSDLAASDIPSLDAGKITSGTFADARIASAATWNGKIDSAEKGANNGVAELDSNGKVPSSQLPSYVDDVLEYASVSAFPATGEAGKIYVALDTNKTYRWSGSTYVEISASLALGETENTAYRGDRGKTAYDHSQIVNGNPHGSTQDDIGDGTTYKQYSATEKTKLSGVEIGATKNYKYVATNPSMSESGGAWTWSIPAFTHGISSYGMIVQLYEVSTGNMVVCDVSINASYQVSIVINDTASATTLAADTYRVVIMG